MLPISKYNMDYKYKNSMIFTFCTLQLYTVCCVGLVQSASKAAGLGPCILSLTWGAQLHILIFFSFIFFWQQNKFKSISFLVAQPL